MGGTPATTAPAGAEGSAEGVTTSFMVKYETSLSPYLSSCQPQENHIFSGDGNEAMLQMPGNQTSVRFQEQQFKARWESRRVPRLREGAKARAEEK